MVEGNKAEAEVLISATFVCDSCGMAYALFFRYQEQKIGTVAWVEPIDRATLLEEWEAGQKADNGLSVDTKALA